MKNESITIIGCGIVGICIGLKLQSQGFNVTILDKSEPVSGCSHGNAGHFGIEQIFPMASLNILKSLPATILDPNGPLSINPSYIPKALPWMFKFLMAARKKQFEKGTKALYQINKKAMPSYFPLIKMAQAEHLIQKKGYLLAFEGINGLKLALQEYNKLKDYDFSQSIIKNSDIKQLEPDLHNCNAAIYYPDIYHTTDPLKFTKALFKCFVSQGGKFEKSEVLQLIPKTGVEIELKTTGRIIKAHKVVLATGAYGKNLVKQLGYKIPLDTERGYHLMVNHQGCLNRPVAFAQRKFIMTPMDQGIRLAGTVEFAGLIKKPNWKRSTMLLDHAKRFLLPLNKINTNDCDKWMGFRPTFPDSLPVIDKDTKHMNLFYAFGHQHLGLTQAAVTADLITDLVEGIKPSINMKPFSINRF